MPQRLADDVQAGSGDGLVTAHCAKLAHTALVAQTNVVHANISQAIPNLLAQAPLAIIARGHAMTALH